MPLNKKTTINRGASYKGVQQGVRPENTAQWKDAERLYIFDPADSIGIKREKFYAWNSRRTIPEKYKPSLIEESIREHKSTKHNPKQTSFEDILFHKTGKVLASWETLDMHFSNTARKKGKPMLTIEEALNVEINRLKRFRIKDPVAVLKNLQYYVSSGGHLAMSKTGLKEKGLVGELSREIQRQAKEWQKLTGLENFDPHTQRTIIINSIISIRKSLDEKQS